MLRVFSLASGSSGNAFLVETDYAPLLVEAGLSARTLERMLRQRGVNPASLAAIIISHEHHDHAQGVGPLARRWGIPVITGAATRDALQSDLGDTTWLPLSQEWIEVGRFGIRGFPVPHDAVDPQGIVVAYEGVQIGWALDLGSVPPHVPDALAEVELAIIEANHDRELLIASPYPWSTKHRILGDQGHLSNLQAAELLATIAAAGHLRTAWLAHLSARANDHPAAVLRHMRAYLDMAGHDHLAIAIAERDRPSAVWNAEQWTQQALL